ncbi:DUF4627 domain-containing protein [Pseudopedobacter beijingensis]|uniref:DUF4627 domain-containing protein n=1 Tax=Pseudopedobacter beijingensis TaxID=1207056 RepID=A0ABW4I7U4_9SPHI
MKKTVLFLSLLMVVKLATAQNNLIKDGSFTNTAFMVNDITKKPTVKSVWFPFLTSDEQGILSIEDTDKGKAASLKMQSKVSYAYSYIGQKIEESNVKEGIYSLTFSAKATTELPTYLAVYLRIKTSPQQFVFFPLNNYNPQETPTLSGALKQIRITGEWKEYTIDFDLGKTINGAAAPANAREPIVLEKSTNENRKAFEVAFSCLTKNAGLLFTNVALIKK